MSSHHLPAAVRRNQSSASAQLALGIARRRGLPIPEPIGIEEDVVAALTAVIDSTPDTAAPTLPDRAAEIPKAIGKVAAARAQHDQAQQLARDWMPTAQDRLHGAVQRSVAGWVAPVVRSFTEQMETFRAAAAAAPNIDATQLATLDPVSFTAWQKAQTASHELDATVADRRVLAKALGEDFTSTTFGDLAIVAIAAPPSGVDSAALLNVTRERRPVLQQLGGKAAPGPVLTRGATTPPVSGIEWWRLLLSYEQQGWLRLSLAGLDEAPRRVDLLDSWHNVGPYLHADASNMAGDSGTRQMLARIAAVHSTLTGSPQPVLAPPAVKPEGWSIQSALASMFPGADTAEAAETLAR